MEPPTSQNLWKARSRLYRRRLLQVNTSTRVPPPFWWVLPSALHSEGKVVVANSSTGLQPHLTLDSTIGLRHTFSEKRSGMNTHDMHRTNTNDSEIIMHRTNTHDRKRACYQPNLPPQLIVRLLLKSSPPSYRSKPHPPQLIVRLLLKYLPPVTGTTSQTPPVTGATSYRSNLHYFAIICNFIRYFAIFLAIFYDFCKILQALQHFAKLVKYCKKYCKIT